MAGMLYLVPTPIGNLGDISIRCRETLEQADFIAAEDTRVSLKLLNHLGIKKSLVSYYAFISSGFGVSSVLCPVPLFCALRGSIALAMLYSICFSRRRLLCSMAFCIEPVTTSA